MLLMSIIPSFKYLITLNAKCFSLYVVMRCESQINLLHIIKKIRRFKKFLMNLGF